jgi:hypothetical protein
MWVRSETEQFSLQQSHGTTDANQRSYGDVVAIPKSVIWECFARVPWSSLRLGGAVGVRFCHAWLLAK